MAEEPLDPSVWQQLFDWGQKLTGFQLPRIVLVPIGILVLLAVVFCSIVVIVSAIAKLKELWFEKLLPLAYRAQQRQEATQRQNFASYLEIELTGRNFSENWRDENFAELEAEVEAEGTTRRTPLSILQWVRRSGLWRERNLTTALWRSTERLILLEGDPGSGKSVALRHLALRMARSAKRSRSTTTVLPVYVNMKELKRDDSRPIDRALIRDFILESLNRVNDRIVDEYLEANFDIGMESGRWVFFFDSFDEIPDVLSSTEMDQTISRYSAAISDFLTGINKCRGIIASRGYRGPTSRGWPKFRILELTAIKQEKLIWRSNMRVDLIKRLVGELGNASPEVRTVARSPMLLALLCEHMRTEHEFPTTVYQIFETFLTHRMNRDEERVRLRMKLDITNVAQAAQHIAFALAADRELGLSPTRKSLKRAIEREDTGLAAKLDLMLDALEYMKLGRSDRYTSGDDRQFTFSHRRFQEYFATTFVIKHPTLVPHAQLLLDARWRETAVVFLQIGQGSDVEPLTKEAENVIDRTTDQIRESIAMVTTSKQLEFAWPSGILHLLGILQAGFSNESRVPASLRGKIGTLLEVAAPNFAIEDLKFSLEVCGAAPEERILDLIRSALVEDSQWLNDVVYLQLARLSTLPDDITHWIRQAIVRMTYSGQIVRDRYAIRAHVARLNTRSSLTQLVDFGSKVSFIDRITFFLFAISFLLLASRQIKYWNTGLVLVMSYALFRAIWSSWIPRIFAIMARLMLVYIAFIIWLIIVDPFESSSLSMRILGEDTMAVVLLLYLAGWALAALECISTGLGVSPFLWILAPFVAVITVGARIFHSRRIVRQIPIAVGSAFMIGLLVLLASELPGAVIRIIGFSLTIFGFASILGSAALSCAAFWSDWRRYSSFERGKGGPSADAMISKGINKFRTVFFALMFLKEIASDFQVVGDEDLRALRDIAVLAKNGRWPSQHDRLFDRLALMFFRPIWIWDRSYVGNFRDELFKIIERSRRATTTREVLDSDAGFR